MSLIGHRQSPGGHIADSPFVAARRPTADGRFLEAVAFQPAASRPPSGTSVSGEAHRRGKGSGSSMILRNALLTAGTLVMLTVSIPPVWDAAGLLDDPAFVYMVGKGLPQCVVGACFAAVALYTLAVAAFFRCARAKVPAEHGVIVITTLMLSGLGMVFLLLSQPLTSLSARAYEELVFHCPSGARSQPLAERYQALSQIRSEPQCIVKASVEDCVQLPSDHELTTVLKTIENTYLCSGFCVTAAAESYAAAPREEDTFEARSFEGHQSLSQTEQHFSPGTVSAHNALEPSEEGSSAMSSSSSSASSLSRNAEPHNVLASGSSRRKGAGPPVLLQVDAAQARSSRPPALFSQLPYRTSCEGAMGAALKQQGEVAGEMLFYEGIALLVLTVIVSCTSLCLNSGRAASKSQEDALSQTRPLVF